MSTLIDAPPRAVWREVADVASHVEWMADAAAIELTSPGPVGPGTTFDCLTQVGPFRLVDRMEVTTWRPRRAMGIRHAGVVRGRGCFTLRRARLGRATRFTWDEQLRFPWWLGGPIAGAAARPVLRRIWRGNLRRLKTRVEGRS